MFIGVEGNCLRLVGYALCVAWNGGGSHRFNGSMSVRVMPEGKQHNDTDDELENERPHLPWGAPHEGGEGRTDVGDGLCRR